uniref:Uncharacterized protein n=1 Tax=Coturnix japonica TaxID=93934 RepID=A0A8C2YG71_COTJA
MGSPKAHLYGEPQSPSLWGAPKPIPYGALEDPKSGSHGKAGSLNLHLFRGHPNPGPYRLTGMPGAQSLWGCAMGLCYGAVLWGCAMGPGSPIGFPLGFPLEFPLGSPLGSPITPQEYHGDTMRISQGHHGDTIRTPQEHHRDTTKTP